MVLCITNLYGLLKNYLLLLIDFKLLISQVTYYISYIFYITWFGLWTRAQTKQ